MVVGDKAAIREVETIEIHKKKLLSRIFSLFED